MKCRFSFLSLLVLLLSIDGYAKPLFQIGTSAVTVSGEVTVESRSDRGLTLSFTLPSSFGSLQTTDSPYLSEARVTTATGYQLPTLTRWVVIPPTVDATLSVRSQRGDRVSRTRATTVEAEVDLTGSTASVYPPLPAVIGSPQVMHGVRMVPLTIFPSQIETTGDGLVETRELEPVPIKGISEPVRTFAVLAEKPADTPPSLTAV